MRLDPDRVLGFAFAYFLVVATTLILFVSVWLVVGIITGKVDWSCA